MDELDVVVAVDRLEGSALEKSLCHHTTTGIAATLQHHHVQALAGGTTSSSNSTPEQWGRACDRECSVPSATTDSMLPPSETQKNGQDYSHCTRIDHLNASFVHPLILFPMDARREGELLALRRRASTSSARHSIL